VSVVTDGPRVYFSERKRVLHPVSRRYVAD
jgi:hypothetical protein